jgi:hypothetical protein
VKVFVHGSVVEYDYQSLSILVVAEPLEHATLTQNHLSHRRLLS